MKVAIFSNGTQFEYEFAERHCALCAWEEAVKLVYDGEEEALRPLMDRWFGCQIMTQLAIMGEPHPAVIRGESGYCRCQAIELRRDVQERVASRRVAEAEAGHATCRAEAARLMDLLIEAQADGNHLRRALEWAAVRDRVGVRTALAATEDPA